MPSRFIFSDPWYKVLVSTKPNRVTPEAQAPTFKELARPTMAWPIQIDAGFPGESAATNLRGQQNWVWQAGYVLPVASREQNLEGGKGGAQTARPKSRGYSDCAKHWEFYGRELSAFVTVGVAGAPPCRYRFRSTR